MGEERGPEKKPGGEELRRRVLDEYQEWSKKVDDLSARLDALEEKAAAFERGELTEEEEEELRASANEIEKIRSDLRASGVTFKRRLDEVTRSLEQEERRLLAEKEIADLKWRSAREAALEGLKLEFEANKNLTFLGSGALVAYAVVTANLFPDPEALGQLGVAYGLMVMSLIATSIMMFYIASFLTAALAISVDAPSDGRWRRRVVRVVDFAAGAGFFGSLLSFLQFLMANLT